MTLSSAVEKKCVEFVFKLLSPSALKRCLTMFKSAKWVNPLWVLTWLQASANAVSFCLKSIGVTATPTIPNLGADLVFEVKEPLNLILLALRAHVKVQQARICQI